MDSYALEILGLFQVLGPLIAGNRPALHAHPRLSHDSSEQGDDGVTSRFTPLAEIGLYGILERISASSSCSYRG